MKNMEELTKIAISTLAEAGEADEDIVCAATICAGASLEEFNKIKSMFLDFKLATAEPGAMLRATDRLLAFYHLIGGERDDKVLTHTGVAHCPEYANTARMA